MCLRYPEASPKNLPESPAIEHMISRFQGLCIRISVILFFVFNSARG